MSSGKRAQIERVRRIYRHLLKEYHTPDLGNVPDVFGELVYALLSTRTAPANYQKSYHALRGAFSRWSDLADASERELCELLRPCGLHRRKAQALAAIAKRVFKEEGFADLEHLRALPTREAERYLMSLPGVGIKVAKCIALYALGRAVFPVDVHNLRVLKRLGFVHDGVDARNGAGAIEAMIPARLRHHLHVNLVAHGRAVCRRHPRCTTCVLVSLCPYPAKARRFSA